ncbi:hypothetical protein [Streptomyces mirabilis]|uniref:hypothetical protein n=1 Tax=Streptomyces mirabilis TaxID=68239 RepID=UPI002930C235|nr:hypothetical protein [Streptomyces mirabilis]
MSRRNVPYGLMFDQNSAVKPRRSSSVSFLAHAGSARICWSSSVLTCSLNFEVGPQYGV